MQPRIGLMLGAGGIRGCAHAGVMAALEASGVVADVVVGASIGAIFGLAYAAGLEVQQICRRVEELPRWGVVEFYRNRLRVDRRTVLGAWICDVGEDLCFEDLPRPFACMAVDRDTGHVVALSRGPVLRAVQASIALPWIATPVEIDGRRYMDGGLRGPIPPRIAQSLGAERIIRVDLGDGAGVDRMPAWVQRAHGLVGRYRQQALLRSTQWQGGQQEPGGADAAELLEIRPRFFGLSRNSPLGTVFCMRRGERAARLALALTARQPLQQIEPGRMA